MRFVAEEKVRAAFDREGTCKEFSPSIHPASIHPASIHPASQPASQPAIQPSSQPSSQAIPHFRPTSLQPLIFSSRLTIHPASHPASHPSLQAHEPPAPHFFSSRLTPSIDPPTPQVSGELVATPGDASLAGASLRVAIQRPAGDPYVWKTHPVINKQSFAENVLTTAPGKPFPARVMKWRYDGPASSQLGPPLSVSVWGGDEDPDGNGMIAVTLEYELLRTAMTLHNVLLCMQCSHSQTCSWSHAMIDRSTASGSIEIRMPQVSGVMAEAGPVPFVLEKALTTDVYSIGP
ncbi:Coatomer subunit delta (CopD) [Paratrimastix pyriformis]|uniref:Coatomer subunit delta (CopD) n=1 Tax=Paratrimastix pyriformis TaxID=342808 RepID=A0ABQ8UPI1_9EUKA|nr:Coatomer subunit delta (CopD) [Paratrimastix pyriformis]